jgi:hypothetical protein
MSLFRSKKLHLTVSVCLLLNSRHVKCLGKEDDDKSTKDFKYFIKGFGEKAGRDGRDAFNTFNGVKNEKINEDEDKELLESASDYAFKIFESGAPGQVIITHHGLSFHSILHLFFA